MKTQTKPMLAALLLATVLSACAGTSSKTSTGEYIDDTAITTKVKTAFVQDKTVDALDIKVDTFKGTVQLSGFADTPSQIDRAVEIARATAGVKAVKNDIRLKQR